MGICASETRGSHARHCPCAGVLLLSFASPVYVFKALFSDIPVATRKESDHAVQCITKALWQYLPTSLLLRSTSS